jgi:hypothetical protein
VTLLEARGVLEVQRGHGRGSVNFYRILREEDGQPVPHKREKKVKSATPLPEEKVKFPTPPEPKKVKSETSKLFELLTKSVSKVVSIKEREEKEDTPIDYSPEKVERQSPFWCETHGFCHSERLPDHRPDCWRAK